ncbi:hypothetical protein KUCAC02_029231, partial [Chaenocephalus aceratus]
STETSPASSLQSLPISPCSEKSLPFKESAKAALKMKDCQMTDHATQTEHMGPEFTYYPEEQC